MTDQEFIDAAAIAVAPMLLKFVNDQSTTSKDVEKIYEYTAMMCFQHAEAMLKERNRNKRAYADATSQDPERWDGLS